MISRVIRQVRCDRGVNDKERDDMGSDKVHRRK